MELLQGAVLIGATMTTGLTAGVFGIYAVAIMPGLARTDDRAFIAAFQSIDRAIINPWFMSCFLGAPVLSAAAIALHLGDKAGAVLPWVVTALVLYLTAFVITVRIHVPRNDEIKAAGDPERISDPAAVRARFDEPRWARWNIVRAIVTTTALGCLAWALVEYGSNVLAG